MLTPQPFQDSITPTECASGQCPKSHEERQVQGNGVKTSALLCAFIANQKLSVIQSYRSSNLKSFLPFRFFCNDKRLRFGFRYLCSAMECCKKEGEELSQKLEYLNHPVVHGAYEPPKEDAKVHDWHDCHATPLHTTLSSCGCLKFMDSHRSKSTGRTMRCGRVYHC